MKKAKQLLKYLKENSIDFKLEVDNLTVGGSLYLGGTAVTALPDNLTVGGYLDLRGTGITALPDNLTVGGSLYLEGTAVTALPDNLTVGGSLDLEGTGITAKAAEKVKKPTTTLLKFKRNYVSADGILTEVINKKGNTYTVRNVGKKVNGYLVTDGKFTHAHGETLAKAKEDFRFKQISEKLKKDPITKDTVITIQYYRIVTGACESGVKNWMEQNNIKKESYKASELLPILEKTNAYGLEWFKSLITF